MAVKSDFLTYDYGNRKVVLEKNAQQEEQLRNKLLKQRLDHISTLEKAEKDAKARIDSFEKAGDAEKLKEAKEQLSSIVTQKVDAENQLAKEKIKIQDTVNNILNKKAISEYNKQSIQERKTYSKKVAENLKDEIELIEAKKALNEAAIKSIDASDVKNADKIKELQAEATNLENQLSSAIEQKKIADEAVDLLFNKMATKAEIAKKAQEEYSKSEELAQAEKAAFQKFEEEQLKKIHAARRKGDFETAKQLQTELKNREAIYKAAQDEADTLKDKYKEAEKQAQKEKERQEKLEAAEKKRQELLEGFTGRKQLDENLDAIYGDQAKYLAKLQGSTEDWRESVDNVSDAIGFSGIVSKKNVITKMKELVDSGIAYNIEMRAFLAETSANIASTFDATNGTLLRMIRLQQQDSTAARLGMEATLTRLFNQYFEDSSYLANNISESVSAAILDASATMSRDDSLEFEYTMQKWLGALYSLGASDTAVQSIATGINYLGTGNVSALNGNAALQTLLAMSASRAGGKSYAEMLTSGLTAEDTNSLLRAMIEYLAEIADSQENMVTRSAYADLFGMSVTDLSSFASLTTSEINSLYKDTISYQNLVKETSTRLSEISKNMSITDLVSNAIDNAEVGVATTIGSNAFTYGTWKALGLLQDYVGEIKIPSVLAAGFGLSSDIDLINVAQTGMVGMGMLGSLLGGLGSMLNGGPDNLSNWDFRESTSRGSGLRALNSGSSRNTSYSAMIGVGSASGSDVEAVSLQSAQDKAYEASGVSSEEIEKGKEYPQKIYDALAGESTPNVLSVLQEIDDRLDPGRVFYTAIAGMLNSEAANNVFTLSSQLAVAKATASTSSQEQSVIAMDNVAKAVSSIGVGGQGLLKSEDVNNNLSQIIEEAVRTAITTTLSMYETNGVPVALKNGGLM